MHHASATTSAVEHPPAGPAETAPAPSTLTARLRDATSERHVRAERHPVQQALVRGQADPRLYDAWLRAMRALHEPFEALLAKARAHPALAGAIEAHHFRLGNIDEDLDALAAAVRNAGANAAPPPPPAPASLRPRTLALWASIESMIDVDAVVIVGPFYVLEGSTNGGRFIAQAVRRSLPLPPGAGTRYLDPHGELIRDRWARTKSAIDALPLSPSQQSAIVTAAELTFDAITALMDELPSVPPPPPSPSPSA